jgi:hypothetical protein
MAHQKSYTCDACGKKKAETNHWFIAEQTSVGLHIHTWEWAVRECQLDEDDTNHLCGQGCVHKFVDGFLAEKAAQGRDIRPLEK